MNIFIGIIGLLIVCAFLIIRSMIDDIVKKVAELEDKIYEFHGE